MKLKKNHYLTKNPTKGKCYKLWSLYDGASAIRNGAIHMGKEIGTFNVVKQLGEITICKTAWDEIFHLDSSLEVIAA